MGMYTNVHRAQPVGQPFTLKPPLPGRALRWSGLAWRAQADGTLECPLGTLGAALAALSDGTIDPSCAASADADGRLAACSCMHAAMMGGSSFGHSPGTLHAAELVWRQPRSPLRLSHCRLTHHRLGTMAHKLNAAPCPTQHRARQVRTAAHAASRGAAPHPMRAPTAARQRTCQQPELFNEKRSEAL